MLGAIGLGIAGGAFHAVWVAIKSTPVAAIGVVLGVALLVFAYRDAFLGYMGVVRPNRIDRQIRDWLHAEHYALTPIKDAPDFQFQVTDVNGNGPYVITMRSINPQGVEVGGGASFGDEHLAMLANATHADLRSLPVRIMSSVVLPSVGFDLNAQFKTDLDPPDFRVGFVSIVMAEDLTFRTLLNAIHTVRTAVATAGMIMGDVAETVKERQA